MTKLERDNLTVFVRRMKELGASEVTYKNLRVTFPAQPNAIENYETHLEQAIQQIREEKVDAHIESAADYAKRKTKEEERTIYGHA